MNERKTKTSGGDAPDPKPSYESKDKAEPKISAAVDNDNKNSNNANDYNSNTNNNNINNNNNNNSEDNDDITSKAAVALAAVAAAAVANNKSHVAAAKEARDLAQSFIQNEQDNTGRGKNSNAPGIPPNSKNFHRSFQTLSLANFKTHLRQRALETGSTVLDKLCQGDNDAFLQHLLLLEYYRCTVDENDSSGNTTTTTSEVSTSESTNANDPAVQACEQFEFLLKKMEAAYDSLVDMLPEPSSRHRKSSSEDNEEFEKPVIVPDLLPPCSNQGDLTVAFFRACQGEDQKSKSTSKKISTSDHVQSQNHEDSSSSLLDSPVTEKSIASPPHSPKGFASVFKRNKIFRKSKRGSAMESNSSTTNAHGSSNSRTIDTTAGETSNDGSNPDQGLRPGEYTVKIEREMLGLTVENVLERTVVRTVVPGGPAKKAGAKIGSLIVQVGNVETKNLTHFETIDELRQSNRPLNLVLRQISEDSLRSAREEMGRLIKGHGYGTVLDRHEQQQQSQQQMNGPVIEADLRIDAYTNTLKRRFMHADNTAVRNKKEEALNRLGEKLIWILTLFVIGLEREASHLFSLADALPEKHHHPKSGSGIYHHTAKDYMDAAKSVSKVLFDYSRKRLDKPRGKVPPPPPPPPPPPRGIRTGPRRNVIGTDTSVAHEKPLLQIGDVLQRVRTFLVDPTSPPAALLRGEVIAFLCDVLDIDTEMELAEEETASSSVGAKTGGGINDLGSAGSLLKLIVLNCPIMRSPRCESDKDDDPELEEELKRRFGTVSSIDRHRLHAGNRFLAVVHRLAASRSTSARIAACSLGPVLWGHLDFPHQLQLRGVITRALHDVEVIVRKSTATVLHEIAELVFDSRCVPWLVLMCERTMTDPEPQLRSAAMTLTWHLAEHLPNAFLGDARQGSRYLRRLPNRDDPVFADVYLLQCKLLPVATRLAEDRSPSVRLAVAAQCDRLCDALGDHWSSVIIDVLLGLLSDSDERVRCEAVSCVPRLSEIVLMSSAPGETAPSEVSILEALFPAAIKLQKDPCVSVRVALATAAGELLSLLVALQAKENDTLNMANHMSDGTERSRSSEFEAGRRYKVHVDDRLIPMVQTLLNDADPEVTSASLRAVTNATRSSVQQARHRHTSVTSNDDDASFCSYQSHTSRGEKPVFLPVLSENQVLRLLPTLTELSDSRQWRVRQSAVEIVPALLGCTTKIETRNEISKLCVRLMGDQVDAVRKTAAECLCMGGSSLGSHGEDAGGQWITAIVIPVIRKCALDNNSKQRLLSLKMVEVILLNGVCPNKWHASAVSSDASLADTPSRELISIALSLTKDRIANVRLNVGRILETVLNVFEDNELSFIAEILNEQIVAEKEQEGGGDVDVIYFSSRCLNRIKSILEDRLSEHHHHVREEVHL